MKQILFTLILINLLLVSKGQNAKIEYGFQSGINISSAYGNNTPDVPLTGLHIGGHLKMNKTVNWSFKVIMTYDEIGWKYESVAFENSTGNVIDYADILFKHNYLNIAVLAEYSFGKKVRIHVDGGLFLGILLNNKIITQYKDPIPPNQDPSTERSSDNRKKTNYGLALGSGIQIPIASNLKLDFDLRNSLGLSNIYKSQTSNVGNIKTNSFTISAGLTFEL